MFSDKNPYKNISKVVSLTLLTSAALWITAACLPAYIALPPYDTSMLGIMCFVWGALFGLIAPMYGIIWGANVFGLIALVRLRRKNYPSALKLALIAVTLSIASLFINGFPRDENGGIDKVTPGPGAVVWILSMVAILIGAYVVRRMSRNLPPEPIPIVTTDMSPTPRATTRWKRISPTRILIVALGVLVSVPIVIGIITGIVQSITKALANG
jgi:hypothetical protein